MFTPARRAEDALLYWYYRHIISVRCLYLCCCYHDYTIYFSSPRRDFTACFTHRSRLLAATAGDNRVNISGTLPGTQRFLIDAASKIGDDNKVAGSSKTPARYSRLYATAKMAYQRCRACPAMPIFIWYFRGDFWHAEFARPACRQVHQQASIDLTMRFPIFGSKYARWWFIFHDAAAALRHAFGYFFADIPRFANDKPLKYEFYGIVSNQYFFLLRWCRPSRGMPLLGPLPAIILHGAAILMLPDFFAC